MSPAVCLATLRSNSTIALCHAGPVCHSVTLQTAPTAFRALLKHGEYFSECFLFAHNRLTAIPSSPAPSAAAAGAERGVEAVPQADARARGRAVHVDPIKPTLRAPGSKHLKPKYDEPLLNFAFNSSLRRYTAVWCDLDLSSHASFLTDRIMLNIMRNDGAFGLLRSICLSGRAARMSPFRLNSSRLY
jgi:hypothetical protein